MHLKCMQFVIVSMIYKAYLTHLLTKHIMLLTGSAFGAVRHVPSKQTLDTASLWLDPVTIYVVVVTLAHVST